MIFEKSKIVQVNVMSAFELTMILSSQTVSFSFLSWYIFEEVSWPGPYKLAFRVQFFYVDIYYFRFLKPVLHLESTVQSLYTWPRFSSISNVWEVPGISSYNSIESVHLSMSPSRSIIVLLWPGQA